MNQTVSDLLARYGAPATFEVELPEGEKWTIKGFSTFSAKRAHEAAKASFVAQLMSAKNAAVKKGDDDLLPVPYRLVSELMDEVNLDAAFEIHSRVVSPELGPVEALQLCAAPQLVSHVLNSMTWHTANYLVEIKGELYGEAKKDLPPTNSPD